VKPRSESESDLDCRGSEDTSRTIKIGGKVEMERAGWLGDVLKGASEEEALWLIVVKQILKLRCLEYIGDLAS
jgi:hypothetical protein